MINEKNFKKILKKGEIINNDIVELFGSDKTVNRYKQNNKVDKDMKKQMFNKAKRYCEITDLGSGKYEITEVYDYAKPLVLEKMKKSMYQYIVPLILIKLLDKHDENNKVVFPLLDWAKFIGWINNNFKPIKYHKYEAGEKLNIDIKIINEFFEKVEYNVRTYMENSLNFLHKADTLLWYKVMMLHKRKTDMKNTLECECYYSDEKATDEEIKFVIDSCEKIRRQMGIKDRKDCYYGHKADEYRKRLKEELLQKDIVWYYDSYEVFYTDIDRCKRILNEFSSTDEKSLIKDFNNSFIDYLIANAEKRKEKEFTKEVAKMYRLDENYISNFKTLSELTMLSDQEWNVYKEIDIKDDINERMKEDFPMELINKKGERIN